MAQMMRSDGLGVLQLTLAVCDYAHTREIAQGIVRADGISLTPLVFPSIEEITFRFVKHLEWDVSELSFGKYISLTSQGDAPMVAIPVFPSRIHRLSAIYVRSDRGVHRPKDLEGRKVGVPEWAQTAGIYVRGALSEQYGVDLSSIRWIQAGVDEPGRSEKVKLNLPVSFKYESRSEDTLSSMLERGEVDAVISARAPGIFARPSAGIVRLFEQYQQEEASLYARTSIFPIMHLITIRRSVLEEYPWVAGNLLKAFDEAKRRCLDLLRDFTCSRAPLPWISGFADSLIEQQGGDPFPYGIELSRPTLEAFCRYSNAQGVTHKPITIDDLFPATVRERVRI